MVHNYPLLLSKPELLTLSDESPCTKAELINKVALEIELAKRRRKSAQSIKSKRRENLNTRIKNQIRTERPEESFEKRYFLHSSVIQNKNNSVSMSESDQLVNPASHVQNNIGLKFK